MVLQICILRFQSQAVSKGTDATPKKFTWLKTYKIEFNDLNVLDSIQHLF